MAAGADQRYTALFAVARAVGKSMSELNTRLRTFLLVAQFGSFRRVADEMNVTQAAVTARIKSLEYWLGFEVFDRSRRGVTLTPQGDRFLEYARRSVTAAEQGREDARQAKTFRGHLRFMSQYFLLEGITLDWLGWMEKRAPDVAITVDCSNSWIAARDINAGLLDLAVGYQSKTVPGVKFEPLFTERLVLVTSFPEDSDWRGNYIPTDWDDAFIMEQAHIMETQETEYRIRSAFVDVVRMLLSRLHCSGYLVERVATPLIDAGKIRLVENMPVFERPAHAIYPLAPVNAELLDIALEGLRETAKGITVI